jgi:hypothetical protein
MSGSMVRRIGGVSGALISLLRHHLEIESHSSGQICQSANRRLCVRLFGLSQRVVLHCNS